nr:DUF1573 domain-containing protein [uncultured Bacteroides sp.]
MKYLISVFICLFLLSCGNQEKKYIERLLQTWSEKEVLFPANSIFTIKGKDTVDFSMSGKFKILTYVDTLGCISCKLQLDRWKVFMEEVDGMTEDSVRFIYFFSPEKRKKFLETLRFENFTYPVCIDDMNQLNALNNFPSGNEMFHTFLLDKDNKVLAIGNPIHNPKVKELYLKIIQGEKATKQDESKEIKTEVAVDKPLITLGDFNWKEEQKATFTLKNTGGNPLVIQDVTTSCGCTTVSYSKEPTHPGKEITLEVVYKAEHPEHFSKTVTVHCNTASSPIRLSLSGDAK